MSAGDVGRALRTHPSGVLLAGQLVLVLDPDSRARMADHDLHYTREHGLEVQRA